MKKLQLIFTIIVIALAVASCKDKKQEKAQKSFEAYSKYLDSLSNVSQEKAIENWELIENNNAKLKSEAVASLAEANDKTQLQSGLDDLTIKFEVIKANVISEKEKKEESNSKTKMYESLFGPSYINDDMQFKWVNKDNILSVYETFVNTVQKNKDTYSREDWDEIKLVYEALDSRKNTVEKEGLSSNDNNKIAALKLKFAPMYTVNRIGAKSEENANAKK